MVEIHKDIKNKDSFIKIDDQDISKLGLNFLRKNISIIPEIEHFINQNISLGLRAGYLFSANENNILDSKNTDEGYLLGIFGKYYFNTKKRISFFTETSLS